MSGSAPDFSFDRLLLDLTSDMLLAVDPGTQKIAAANQKLAATLGYSPEALLGRDIADVESGLADIFYWEDIRHGGRGEVEGMESLYACADGTVIPVLKTIRRLAAGGREWLLLRVRDQREDKRAGRGIQFPHRCVLSRPGSSCSRACSSC